MCSIPFLGDYGWRRSEFTGGKKIPGFLRNTSYEEDST